MMTDKLTPLAEKIAYSRVISPVIIKAKQNKYHPVLQYLIENFTDFGGGILRRGGEKILDFIPQLQGIKTFGLIAAILPREWIFDLADSSEVERIFPNTQKYAFSYPTVPKEGVFEYVRGAFREPKSFTTTAWTRKLMGADIANSKGYTGTGIRAVVTDTGAAKRHPALRHVIQDTAMRQVHDENGHGTHVTATVGGRRAMDSRLSRKIGRDIWTEGMAPNATLIAIKCLGYWIGTGFDSQILGALELSASKYQADVVSMSLGGTVREEKPEDDPFCGAVKELTEKGATVVIAAGNEGPDPTTIGTPGWCPDALTVAAFDPMKGDVAWFSSRGPTPDGRVKPDCIAPGVNIHAPIVGNLDKAGDNTRQNYSPLSGTSMATPHVSGLVVLMKQAYELNLGKRLTTQEIKAMLEELGHEKTTNDGWGTITWEKFETWMSTEHNVEV